MGPQVALQPAASPSWPWNAFRRCRLPAQWTAAGRWASHQLLTKQTRLLLGPQTPTTHSTGKAAQLKLELCRRLPRCPQVVPPTARPVASGIELGLAAGAVWLTPESGPSWVATRPLCWPPSRLIQRQRRGRRPVSCAGGATGPLPATQKKPSRVGLDSAKPQPPAPAIGARRCGAWPATFNALARAASPTVSRIAHHDAGRAIRPTTSRHPDPALRLAGLSLLPAWQGCRQSVRGKAKQTWDDLEAGSPGSSVFAGWRGSSEPALGGFFATKS